MRKLSVILLPMGCILLISLSFYLLSSHLLLPSVQEASAASHTPKMRFLSSQKLSPAPKIALSPTPITKNILTPTSTPTPTLIPTPTNIPAPTSTPLPTPTTVMRKTLSQVTTIDSVQGFIMQKINEYRSSQGLSAVSTDSNTCGFAKTRAQEISSSFNHDGFTNRINSHTLPYSSYHQVTENIAMTSNYQEVVTMWVNSPGHAENMRQDTPFVCVERNGDFYDYEGWRP